MNNMIMPALMVYLRQCYQEKSKYCLLSRKELAMILPNKKRIGEKI